MGEILEAADYSHGWDAQTGEFGGLYNMGIIDPTKVVRAAIEDASRSPAC